MKDAGPSDVERNPRKPRYDSMEKSELKALAVLAIREHRQLLAADQAVYEEWLRASDDPSITSSVFQTLQNEYLARQKRSGAQQEELSEILDALGFVPDVPLDNES
ncbi:transcriptional repressor TraM (plasmid) [Rhizobium etli]|uniref:Transcriptional repressor TraM n=1 Tax=Rhizobium etli TaxID=29449 RepID=A0AAN1EN62_RHIET|nr:transcriptional repressor TraM [Rhizobium etli]ARQ13587.1 transcriptional repressor TraM [Rhizobium etli]